MGATGAVALNLAAFAGLESGEIVPNQAMATASIPPAVIACPQPSRHNPPVKRLGNPLSCANKKLSNPIVKRHVENSPILWVSLALPPASRIDSAANWNPARSPAREAYVGADSTTLHRFVQSTTRPPSHA